jgi:hypothetical protein
MRSERRRAVGILIVICGIAIVAGARLRWLDARGQRPASGITGTSITGLLHWSYQPCQTFYTSFSFTVIVAGALVVIGGLVASKLLAGLFSFVALVASGLWIALNAWHYSTVSLSTSDLRIGAWLTLGGGLVGLLSSSFVRGRGI